MLASSPSWPQTGQIRPAKLTVKRPAHAPGRRVVGSERRRRVRRAFIRTPADEIVIAAVGDVMLGSTYPDPSRRALPPRDALRFLSEVKLPLASADVTIGNLEGPLLDRGSTWKCAEATNPCFAFRVPTRYSRRLRAAGFDVMGLANNHIYDFGKRGMLSTRAALDAAGIAHTGQVGDVARLWVKGKKVDVIAFATYPGTYNLLNLDDAVEVVKKSAADADIVLVTFHGGGEGMPHLADAEEFYLGEDRGNLRQFTHAVIDAGAHFVFGHGPHVVRGIEIYNGRLIAYSLGNFATYKQFSLKGDAGTSLILEVHLGLDGSFRGGRVYPIKQEKPGGPKIDVEKSVYATFNELAVSDFQGSGVTVTDFGQLVLPPVASDISHPSVTPGTPR